MLDAGVPFLGICLGLQALLEASEEAPRPAAWPLPGYGHALPRRLAHAAHGLERGRASRRCRLLDGLPANPISIRPHYYVPVSSVTAATCTYSVPYTAVLEAGNVFGVQFHPEKSGPWDCAS